MKLHFPRFHWLAILTLAALVLFGLPAPAQADVAPPQLPGGSNPIPGADTGTQVEMASEQVTITVGDVEEFKLDDTQLSGVHAQVEAIFQMHNTGEADEEMQVRFPLMDPSGIGDGFSHMPKLADFTVQVDGQPVDWINVETANPISPDKPPVQWAAFDAAFPAGADVEITVDYSTHSTGFLPEATFNYILNTGAGWKGPIGSGDIILKMPYIASRENVLSWQFESAPEPTMKEDEVRWHFENLEPKREDNWSATILSPDFMNQIYDLREVVADNPEDANALKDLGDLYLKAAESKGIYSLRPGAEHYVLQAEDAYLRSLVIRPDDVSTNSAYLEALAAHYLGAETLPDAPAPTLNQIANQANVVLSLDPENQQAMDIYSQLGIAVPDLPTLGAEPTLVSTLNLPTPSPTATRRVPPTPLAPNETPVPTPLAVSNPPLGISNVTWTFLILSCLCIATLLAVIAVLVVLVLRSRKR